MALRTRLDETQRERLAKALLSGFPTRQRLDEFIDFGLDKRPDDYPGGVTEAVRKLLTDVIADSDVAKLITKAAKRTPNAEIAALHDEYFSLTSPHKRGPAFERPSGSPR